MHYDIPPGLNIPWIGNAARYSNIENPVISQSKVDSMGAVILAAARNRIIS